MQADLLFKQEEKKKSEATAKTLDVGKSIRSCVLWDVLWLVLSAVHL